MALNKRFRLWLIILAIPVVLIVAALITAKLYFTSDRLKALIIPKMEEASHRSVTVKTISLSIFPTLGVDIDELKISNPKGSKFEHDEFLSIDRLTLDVKIFSLLANKLEVDELLLEHPKISLEVSANGRKNYSSEQPGKASGGGSGVRVEKNSTGELLLSNLEIRDGEIEYLDKKYDSRMVIAGLHQAMSVESKRGENSLLVHGTSSIERLSYGSLASWYLIDQPLTGESKLTYAIDKDILTFDDVNLKVRELPLAITGTMSKLTEKTIMLDLAVNAPAAEMGQVLSLIPPEMLKKAQGLSSSGDVKFSLNIKGPSSETMNPGTTGIFTITNGAIRYASLPKSITNVNLQGSFEKPSAPIGATGIGKFSINRFTAKLGGDEISGSMTMNDFSDPALTATVSGSMNLREVKDYYPLEEGTELGGTMRIGVGLDGKVKNPLGMKASGKAEFQDVTIKTAGSRKPLRNLNGAINFNNQVIESKQLAMNIGESDLNLNFTVRNYIGLLMQDAAKAAGKPTASVTLTSKQFRTADVIPDEPPTKPPASAGGISKGTPPATSGLLPAIDIDANVQIDKLVTDKFTFTNAHGSSSVSNGVITLKNMSVNAFQGQIQSKGKLDLTNPAKKPFDLDLNITGVESNEMLSKFTTFGQYLFGKFSTSAKLKGDLNDTLGLNTQSLIGNGSVQIFDGKLLGFPLTTKLADATGISELREVNFKNWANAFSIENGRIQVKDLKVNSGSTDFLMAGSQGLDGSMDYTLGVKLPESLSSRIKLGGAADQLLQFFKDKDGRINLTFDVTGMTASPVVRLNAKAQEDAAKNALQQKANDAKKKFEDDLKKKAEEGLMKIFKKP